MTVKFMLRAAIITKINRICRRGLKYTDVELNYKYQYEENCVIKLPVRLDKQIARLDTLPGQRHAK